MENFTFNCPTKIHFGQGKLETLGVCAKKYGAKCLLVTTSNDEMILRPLYDRVKNILSQEGVEVIHFDEVVPNPTVQSIEKAISMVKELSIDVIVAVGGGSSMDTGKAIATFYQPESIDWDKAYEEFTSPFMEYAPVSNPVLPLIAVPTTAGTGSELTQAMVISDTTTEEKVCIFHSQAFAKEAIIDSQLTWTLPTRLTAITGFDAFSHSFESYMRSEASPYTKLIGLKAMADIIYALPRLMETPKDVELREMMSVAEMFSGISLANAAATIPHPLSEVIGGIAARIPHGQALACLYPAFLEYQITQTPEKCAHVARLFQPDLQGEPDQVAAEQLPQLMVDFIAKLDLATSLSELGVTQEEMEKMEGHFLLTVLPYAPEAELKKIMRGAFG